MEIEIVMETKTFAKQIRYKSLEMVYNAKASHVAGALSIADVLAVLYNTVMHIDSKNPDMVDRDYLIYSKGHTCVALYAALALKGFYPEACLNDYGKENSPFISHVSSKIPGVEFSTGSLGHGLPVSCGLALAFKRQLRSNRVFCIVGDGEMDEGSNWEAMLFAAQNHLDNLCLLVDVNKIQAMGETCDIINLENLSDKFSSFGWSCFRIDGNDISNIENALAEFPSKNGNPTAIICDTIKGKGVSFMEGNLRYHYAPPSKDELDIAIKELGISDND